MSKDYVDEGVPVLRGSNLGYGKWIGGEFAHVTRAKFERDLARNSAAAGDLVFTQRGTLGQVALVPLGLADEFVVSQSQMRLRVDSDRFDAHYVYYACTDPAFIRALSDRAIRTGVPHINLGILAELSIPDREVADQRAIAEVLGALDDKIAANDRLVAISRALGDARYLRAIRSKGETVDLGSVVEFHNRRRVPLSGRERSTRPGTVPYYGAAGVVDYVDQAMFDGEHVLVGEDGTVITDDGRPVVQYIWGPAWVNNHAHVLTSSALGEPLLEAALRHASIAHLVTGAVQPKVSMGNLKRLELVLPAAEARAELAQLLRAVKDRVKAAVEQSQTLVEIRDTLLPALMSGRLSVNAAEAAVEASTSPSVRLSTEASQR